MAEINLGKVTGQTITDKITITENINQAIQTVAIIDENTSNANKFWTGTRAEYDAITIKDPNTFYAITDEANGGFATITYVDSKPTILSGTSEPTPDIGKNGDIYILID